MCGKGALDPLLTLRWVSILGSTDFETLTSSSSFGRVLILGQWLRWACHKSHLTPLTTRTTNKELSTNSFMTKMMQSYVDRSFMLLRFDQPSFSFITRHRHHSFYCEPYSEGVLEKATWPPSPRVRPIRNWAPLVSWLNWCNRMSIEGFMFLRFERSSFPFTTCHHHHFVSSLNSLFWGGPQESHLTPLSTRTTNKELIVESFLTKIMPSYVNRNFMF